MGPIRYVLAGAVFLSAGSSLASPADASTTTQPPSLPAPISLDKTSCAEGPLIVKLHLDVGEELPFKVDTGSLITLLDESLTSKLGHRMGTGHVPMFDQRLKDEGIYQTPKLYAGETQLLMGAQVYTINLHCPPAHMYKGILGVDCLRHYCVQFDFVAGKMRFLDPDHVDTSDLGASFVIDPQKQGMTFFDADLFGLGKMHLLLDTGFDGPFDAILASKVFDKLARTNPTTGPDWIMQLADGRAASGSIFPSLKIEGQTYTDLRFSSVDLRPKLNKGLIGMRFLARHKITLNYPKRTLYLKLISSAPLTKASSPMANDAIAN